MRSSPAGPLIDLETGHDRQSVTALIAAALILISPAIFVLLTYEHPYAFSWTRYFSLPILLAEMGVTILAVTAGARPLRRFLSLTSITRAAAAVFLISICISALPTKSEPTLARIHALISLLHCVFALSLFAALRGPWKRHSLLILRATGGAVALFAITAYLMLWSSRDIPDFNWTNVGTGISNVRHFGYFGIVGASLGASLLIVGKSRSQQMAAWLMLTIGSALIFWNGGRSAMVALIVAIGFTLLLADRSERVSKSIAFVATFSIAFILSRIWVPDHQAWGFDSAAQGFSRYEGGVQAFTSNRTVLWTQAWAGFLDRPFFGHGEGQFRSLSRLASGKGLNHPPNAIFQSLFQWGLIGTTALAVLHLRPILSFGKALDRQRDVVIPASAGIAGLGVVAMVDGPLFYVGPSLFWIITVVVFASAVTAANADAIETHKEM